MSKRGAASELTKDNWNDGDEPEEAGTFKVASLAVMAKRKVMTAKRSGGGANPVGERTSIFKEISGLANFGAKTDSNSAPSFNFSNKDSSKSSSSTTGRTDLEPKKFTFGASENKNSKLPVFSFSSINTNNKSTTSEKKMDTPFMTELKSLNETFLKCIKQHLDENVYENLTPVLEDYKKNVQKLSEKHTVDVNTSDKKEESNEKENKPDSTNVKSNEPASSIDSDKTDKASEELKPKENKPDSTNVKSNEPASSIDSDTTDKASEELKPKDNNSKKTAIDFGFSKNDDSKPSLFGNTPSLFDNTDSNSSNSGSRIKFGTGSPLTFGGFTDSSSKPFSLGGFATAIVPTPATKEETEEVQNDDDDEPPKVIVTEVKEDDAIYEKKCKLFYIKDKEYVERGLGTLFLKKAEEKTQLIVRANTNLGNILLNIIIGPSIIAMMRVGKNIMIVCIPNPPIDLKSDNKTPVKMLIRVKTSEDAEELLKILEEHKKGK